MKAIALIMADLRTSPMGTRSRLAEMLAGKPVIRHTLERVSASTRVDSIVVLAPAEQIGALRDLCAGLNVTVQANEYGPAPYHGLVQACRWWGLDGWRGGPAEMCAFDEDVHIVAAERVAAQHGATLVVCVPAAAALIDPSLIDSMVTHYEEQAGATRMVFVQAPPGLAPVIFDRQVLSELSPTGQPPGLILAYHPERPAADLTGREACYRPAAAIIESSGRLIADTTKGFRRLSRLVDAGATAWTAGEIAQAMSSEEFWIDDGPDEIEIELTTNDLRPARRVLTPGSDETGQRGPIDLEVLRRIGEALRGRDDVRIVLGGFGDPCLHPQFGEACRILRGAGAAALATRTTGLCDESAVEAALFETPVDVIEVMLDANTAATYQLVHGVNAFEKVVARVERWADLRIQRKQVRPLVIPSFVKARQTLQEMEAFYDRWIRRVGMAVIRGYSHCAGQREDYRVTSTTPPVRKSCQRINSRLLVLSNGCVTTCDQDYRGQQSIGDLRAASLAEIWAGESLRHIRADWNSAPLCPSCDEWHRP
jgi:spore coat polysaccharide biosynthesis protein SpsF (cytidylyltransferase family)